MNRDLVRALADLLRELPDEALLGIYNDAILYRQAQLQELAKLQEEAKKRIAKKVSVEELKEMVRDAEVATSQQ